MLSLVGATAKVVNEWLAELSALGSSVHCAHMLCSGFSPSLATWSCWQSIPLHPGSYFSLLPLPKRVQSHPLLQMSSPYQYLLIHFYPRPLWAPTLNPTMYFIFLLGCLKFPTCPDRTQDLPSSPNLFSSRISYHTSHCTSQKFVSHPKNFSLCHALEPIHCQVLLVLPVEYLVTLTAILHAISISLVYAAISHLDLW